MPGVAVDACEVVIRIGVRRRREGRGWVSPESELQSALRLMRMQGYEVDLYIRGTWRRGNGRLVVMPETLWEQWRMVGATLQGTPVLPKGDWLPGIHHQPPPEIVLRGVRNGHR